MMTNVIKEVTKDIRNKVKVGMKEHRIAKNKYDECIANTK